ncbi:MAG: 2-oxo acid dehydrogenase subunit E2 [Rhodobacteraceae bacterium]|jgi:pyruvate dehydrogenase E2 component (dihydrolipoamide acetyltransferase)|nr:2-oxo acid dehydrogenase subunit E2 [Paracoccaceae bacterium]
MSIFAMPSLGADMETGKLVEWQVKPGDRVARGDIVAVVETQKGAIEIEIFEAGEVTELLAEVGQTLPVGAPLARIGEPAGAEAAHAPRAAAEATIAPTGRQSPQPVSPPPPSRPAPAAGAGEVFASPAARARASEAGLDIATLPGSGPGGAVLLADVERHLAGRSAPVAEAPRGKPGLDMTEMRRAIAAAMSRAKREIPHYYLSHEIDLQAAHDRLTTLNAERTPDRRLLMGALLIRATVQALAKVPELNGRFETEPYAPSAEVNCGIAVAMRGGGLIAPAILGADAMDADAIMDAMRDLVARARAGRLRNSEITRGTITVSSLGESGVDTLFGVIYPPQVALVGFGTPRLRPTVRDGRVEPRVAVTVTLAADHRVSDGRRGALFLAEIDRRLQEPDTP